MKFISALVAIFALVAVASAQCYQYESGLIAEYFNGITLSGTPVITRYENINYDWKYGSPGGGLFDKFSVRWSGYIIPPVSGDYRLMISFDDGDRVWVDGVQIDNRWKLQTAQNVTFNSGPLNGWIAGKKVPFKVEYYENEGFASANVYWILPGQTKAQAQAIPFSAYSNDDCISGEFHLAATNNVTLSPPNYSSTTQLFLTGKPPQTVTYTLNLPDTPFYRFDPCSFTFTQANWNVPQTLTVWHFGVTLNSVPTTLGYLNFTNDFNSDVDDTLVSVGRTSFNVARCAFYQKGQMTTFDGMTLSSQNRPGEYYLLRTPGQGKTTIAVQQEKIVAPNAYPVAVSIWYTSTKLLFSVQGNSIQLTQQDKVSEGNIVVYKLASGYRVKIPDGVLVDLFTMKVQGNAYMNVNIYVPDSNTFYTGTAGLCGNNDGVKSNDLQTPTGSAVAANNFLASWQVNNANSLINNFSSATYGTPPAGTFFNTPTQYCSVPFSTWNGETVIAN